MAQDILIVDDEADIRLLLTGILADEGYATREAGDADQALEALATRRPHLLVLDIWLQNSRLDGLELLKLVTREYPGVPVVMISGHGTIEMAVQAIKDGAYDFIEKPFKADRLLLCADRAIEAARLRLENEELRLRAGNQSDLIGQTARLTFHEVDDSDRIVEVMQTGRPPYGWMMVADQDGQPRLLRERPLLTGDMLTNSSVAYDQFNQPAVGLQFNGEGAGRDGRARALPRPWRR